jgi:hypothetical protein
MAALIRGESMLLKLTISFAPPFKVVCRRRMRRPSEPIAGAGSLSFFML